MAACICPADLGISSSPYTGWQISLHGLANFPTQDGKSPYTAWQTSLHRMAEPLLQTVEYPRLFYGIFRLQVFLQVSLQVLLQQLLHSVVVERGLMKTVIHNFTYSLIHELSNSWTYF
jgi:hypothetical protein